MRPTTFILDSKRDRGFAVAAVMKAADGLQVRISKPTRTNEQNGRLHSLVGDLVAQLAWPKDSGEMHDMDWWKRRMTLGWLLDLKQARWRPEVVTPLEQHDDAPEQFAILLPHTSDLDVEQCASLNVWIEMFGSTNGVVFKEPKRAPEPPPEAYDR